MKKIDILKKLRSSGLRPTKQRVEIAKFLFEREKTFHFTVESLNKLLTKKTTSKIALATVYNTVHAFKTAGHLSEVEVRGNKTYFDTNVSNHHHFYDSETSELIDIDANDIKSIYIQTDEPKILKRLTDELQVNITYGKEFLDG